MSTRILDSAGVTKRIDALDALYRNYDRRRDEFLALAPGAGYEAFSGAYNGMVLAKRAYDECVATPYRIAEADEP